MSYNGSGTFTINSTGQPVVAGTVITASAFNALTADLATGLTTAITKDGQTTTTARITFAQGITSSLVTDSSSVSTGSIITAGGAGIAKNLYVGVNANVAGTLGVTGVATFSAAPIYSSLTASSAVATDASKGLVSVTNTGTGNNVLATSPTITTPTISSLSSAAATALTLQSAGTTAMTIDTSQNVGIGTASPGSKLYTQLSSATAYSSGVTGNGLTIYNSSATTGQYVGITLQGEPTTGNGGLATIMGTTTGSGNMELTFSTRGSATLAERMRISSGGYVTMPYQPIFAAYRTSSQTGTSPFTIVFDTASLNVGSNYSTSTGRFTAPIAGNYYLIFQTLGITGVWSSLDIILYKNGSSEPTTLSARPTSTAGTEAVSNLSTAFGIVTLAASDYVEIKVAGTTIYSDGNAWLKFGGWLVC